MNLHHSDEGCVEIIRLSLLCVEHLNGVRPAGDCEDRLQPRITSLKDHRLKNSVLIYRIRPN